MRTKEELYKIFEENQDKFISGLCGWASRLRDLGIISKKEHRYIIFNKLEQYRIDNAIRSTYCWPVGEIQPRLKWLRKILKQTTKH